MPGLRFKKLPAAQQQQFDQSKKYLEEQFAIEGRALDSTPMKNDQYRGKLNQLQAKYQKMLHDAHFKVQQQAQEQQRVQQLIQQPQQRTRGQEAGLRMELGAEAERLVFPTEQKPYTFQQLGSLANYIEGTAERAEQEPWYHRGAEKTRKSLIDQYVGVIDIIRMDDPRAFGPTRQRQFNDMWNRVMKTDPQFANWFDKQGKPPVEMKMMTAEGQIAGAMKKKALGVTPIGRSLRKGLGTQWGYSPLELGSARVSEQRPRQKVAPKTIKVKSPTGQTGSIPANQWPEAKAAGYTRI